MADVRTTQVLVLRKEPGQGPIHALEILGEGQIQGQASLRLFLDGTVYRNEPLAGRVNFRWRSDWYADKAELRYTARRVTGGRLTLRYRFRD
ncbi:MAG: hypothetical protein ACOVNL_07425 [Prochlorococcaceae cyanobacterium]